MIPEHFVIGLLGVLLILFALRSFNQSRENLRLSRKLLHETERNEERRYDMMRKIMRLETRLEQEQDWRREREVSAEDLAYVMESLGAPVPTDVQKVLDEKSNVLDQILSDLDALEEAG